ncbi:MAG: DNA polymerase III subunit delta [candidate division WOR-3 bacterium]
MPTLRRSCTVRNRLRGGKLEPAYIILGPESCLAEETIAWLRAALLSDDFTDFTSLPVVDGQLLVDEPLQEAILARRRKEHKVSDGHPQGAGLRLAQSEAEKGLLDEARRSREAFDLALFQGSLTDVDKVLMALQTPPLVARRRLVVVRQLEEVKREGQRQLLAAMAKEPASCRIVYTATEATPVLMRLIAETGCSRYVVEVVTPERAELLEEIRTFCSVRGIQINADAAEWLIESCGPSLTAVRNELAKIATALGPGELLDRRKALELTGFWREYQTSEFVEALMQRNGCSALVGLRRLQEWDEPPVKIVAWLAGRFLRLLGTSDHLWSQSEIVAALRRLAGIDIRLKRGHPEPYYLLERFVVNSLELGMRHPD